MTLSNRRQRARRLNSEEAPDPVEKNEDDGPDDEDLGLDYSGVVDSDEEASTEGRADELAKGLGSSGDGLDFAAVFKNTDGDDPDLELDYSGVVKDHYESPEDRRARKVGEAVASELDARGLMADEDDEDAADSGPVQKAGETTADLLDGVEADLRKMNRVESFKQLEKAYYEAGGDPEDPVPRLLEWYNQTHPEASVSVENAA